MNVDHQPTPRDFITNYSPIRPADLLIWEVDDRPKLKIRTVFKLLRDWLYDVNIAKAKKIRKGIQEKWGELKNEAITEFLSEEFGYDHLRKFEYAFLARCLSRKDLCKNVIVDIGGYSFSTIVPLIFGFPETKIISVDWCYHTSLKNNVRYVKGDAMNTNLPDQIADLVICISTLEHIGLGRWGDPLIVDGDIRAMKEAYRILKIGGLLVLTIPYGYPTVVFNLNRIYDSGRVQMLSEGFETVVAEYSLYGSPCNREDIEGKRVTRHIPGYYEDDRTESQRHPEATGGILLLMRKTE